MTEDSKAENRSSKKYIWCLVGNLLNEGLYNNRGFELLFNGTKQFKPGAKLFSSPFVWGDGYERIRVIGRAKDTNKFISIIIESKFITNWRKQKVYIPFVLRRNSQERDQWDSSVESSRIIDEMLIWLPDRTLKPIDNSKEGLS